MQYNSSSIMPPRPARGTLRSFSIVQHNSLGSWDVFFSLMNSVNQLTSPPMIVALQDPPVRRGQLPSFSTYKCFHPSSLKPRVAFYVHPHLLNSVSLLPIASTRSDLFSIDIFAPEGFFELQFTRFRIINAYNLPLKSAPFRTISSPDWFQDNAFLTMVVGDLNLHHPSADPLRTFDSKEYNLSHPYYSQASEHGYSLLNQPGLYTYFPFAHNARPSVLDLAFAISPLFLSFSHWDRPLPSTGSDHVPVLITLESPRFRLPPPSPNWSKTDWSSILPIFLSLIPPPPPSACPSSTFEEWFDTHANKVRTLISSNTPVSRPSPRSKPWWSPILSHLRSAFHSASRTYRSSRDSYDQSALCSADAPILLPLERLSSPIGLPTFRPLPPHQFGKPGSSPPEGNHQGSSPSLTRIPLRASTRPYFYIFFPPPLLRPTLLSLSLPILTTSLSVRRRLRLLFRNPPTPPPLALTRSLTPYGNRFTDHALPSSPNFSLPDYVTDITLPP